MPDAKGNIKGIQVPDLRFGPAYINGKPAAETHFPQHGKEDLPIDISAAGRKMTSLLTCVI